MFVGFQMAWPKNLPLWLINMGPWPRAPRHWRLWPCCWSNGILDSTTPSLGNCFFFFKGIWGGRLAGWYIPVYLGISMCYNKIYLFIYVYLHMFLIVHMVVDYTRPDTPVYPKKTVRGCGILRFTQISWMLLMDQKSYSQPPGMYKNLVNNGINYLPQLVQPDFWTINSISSINVVCDCKSPQPKGRSCEWICSKPKPGLSNSPNHWGEQLLIHIGEMDMYRYIYKLYIYKFYIYIKFIYIYIPYVNIHISWILNVPYPLAWWGRDTFNRWLEKCWMVPFLFEFMEWIWCFFCGAGGCWSMWKRWKNPI